MSSNFIVQNHINENGMIPVIDEDTRELVYEAPSVDDLYVWLSNQEDVQLEQQGH